VLHYVSDVVDELDGVRSDDGEVVRDDNAVKTPAEHLDDRRIL